MRAGRAPAARQSGASLLIALILLAVVLLGSAAILNATSSAVGSVNAAAFRGAALSLTATAENDARAFIASLTPQSSLVAVPNVYSPQLLTTDANGLPVVTSDTGHWPASTCVQHGLRPCVTGTYSTTYYIERFCTDSNAPTTSNCHTSVTQNFAGSAANAATVKLNVAYRVTVWVTGPDNLQYITQVVFAVNDLFS